MEAWEHSLTSYYNLSIDLTYIIDIVSVIYISTCHKR